MTENNLILFDGDCNLCNQSINFIIKNDKKEVFRFASINSLKGKALLNEYQVNNQKNTIFLIQKSTVFTKSTAVFLICKQLDFPFTLLYLFMVFPRFLRDFFYTLVAKNRKYFFKKHNDCLILNDLNSHRFLK